MSEYTFTNGAHSLESQHNFAELSGDFNPVHLDPAIARRTVFGAVVVHGIHNLLSVIENFLSPQDQSLNIRRLKARFSNPLFLHEQATTSFRQQTPNQYIFHQYMGGAETMVFCLETTEQTLPADQSSINLPNFPRHPDVRSMPDIQNLTGEIVQTVDGLQLRQTFPKCLEAFGLDGVVRILGLTRLVGMTCPGFHSMFSGLDIFFDGPRSNAPTRFKVTRNDDRISLIDMNVKGGGMTGTLNTFLRPAPVQQSDMALIQNIVTKNSFKNVRALIIGGSRGLGEITAKIIASGGGHVHLTYHSDKTDGERVCQDIMGSGHSADCLQLDVTAITDDLSQLNPTHLFYFATPRITIRKNPDFDEDLYQRFFHIYHDGLNDALQSLDLTQHLKIFYPSTIAVDGDMLGLQEYARAKQKGEGLCRLLQKNNPLLEFRIERLPPLATDQTASLINAQAQDPMPKMFDILTNFLK